jgi:hypothetical protein
MKKISLYISLTGLILSFSSFASQNQSNTFGALAGPYIGFNAGIGEWM